MSSKMINTIKDSIITIFVDRLMMFQVQLKYFKWSLKNELYIVSMIKNIMGLLGE